ncbi:hypothetical protein ACLB1Q_19735 [Escherichia coli]
MRKYRIRHYCGTGVWQQCRMRRERLIRPTVGHRLSHCRSDKMRKYRIRHYCGTGVWQQCRMRRERLIRPTVGHRLSHCRSDKMRKHRMQQSAALETGDGARNVGASALFGLRFNASKNGESPG